MGTFSQAAFRDAGGRVVKTGPFHDISALPDGFEIADEGFVTHGGDFVTRAEATALLNADHPIQSEELGLEKKEGTVKGYKFSAPTPAEGGMLRITAHLDNKPVGQLTFAANPTARPGHAHDGYHKIGQADVSALHRGRGIYGKMLQLAASHVKKLGSKGLVSVGEFREDAATGAWRRLQTKVKGITTRPSREPGQPDFFLSERLHSEPLNSGSDPKNVVHEWEIEFRRWLHERLTGGKFSKSDEAALDGLLASHGNLGSAHSNADEEIATQMSGYSPENTPEFKAARFLAGAKRASEDAIRSAMVLYDHDFELAALYAYDLPRSETFRQMLRAAMQMQRGELSKAEIDVAAIPRVIEPVLPDSEELVETLRRATTARAIKSIKLDGKHSKGTAIAVDPKTKKKWLIKPGSGKLSPARGVAEEKAPQSHREVAFYKIAEAAGVGDYLPESYLIKIDDVEVAVMELLSTEYQPLDKLRKNGIDVRKLFEKYLKDGTIFKWALLDWVLGNIDRHANNIMVKDGDVKLIDHGSTFAGQSFDPAHDPKKSFIPFYLRAWSPLNFNALDAEQKYEQMPTTDSEAGSRFDAWVDALSEESFREIMTQYGINPEPSLARLRDIKTAEAGQRANRLIGLWAGTVRPQS